MPFLILMVVAASLLTVVTSSSPPAPYRGPVVREAPDTAGAVHAASLQRSPVRVADLTTGTRVVEAQPDGTLKATLSARTVRVKQGDRWVTADPTLVRQPDGTVVPRAVEIELALSGGGSAPMVRYGRDGKRFALSWPGKLPAPALDGPTATYPEVLPGVDLVLRAEVDGYTQHLVVKSAQAAKQAALRRIRLGLAATGVRVAAGREGTLELRDAKGTVVSNAPPSAMWDSAGESAVAAVTVDGRSLTLVPDQKLLTGAKTRYPVVIDPGWAAPWRSGWTKVFAGKANSAHWNGGNDVDGWGKVGYCGWGGCNGIGTTRSYFQFETGFLGGKRIISAAFNATIVYGPSCNVRDHQLFMANATIHGGTTWNNAPPGWHLGNAGAGSNYNGCGGNKPIGFDVRHGLNTVGPSVYFLKAADEGDKYAWRKYDANATTLVVNYNSPPNAPYDLSTDPPLRACRWCGGVPYTGNASIRLQTRLSDPDNDQVKPIWEIHGGPSVEHRNWGPLQGSGAFFSTDLDLDLRKNQHVTWKVRASDNSDDGPLVNGPGFVVDRDGVTVKPGVTSALYDDDNRWHGGVGVPDTFTFDAAGVKDIDHYLYGWQSPPSTKVDAAALGGPASVTLAPPADGPQTLYVRSVDRAGHPSPTREYRVYVRAGNGPLAQWAMDGNTRDTAFLGDRDGTLSGPGSYEAGAVGTGLRLDGSGLMSVPNGVRTDASFSVSAWVKLDKVDTRAQTIIQQNGAVTCAFCLQYDGDRKRFVFVLPQADSSSPPGWDLVTAPTEPVAGQWTHLAGVYDAQAKRIRLYVDGVLAGGAERKVSWHGANPLYVGYTLAGVVDEVRAYDRVLSEAEVRAAVRQDDVQVGHWKFDEQEGATAGNEAPGGMAGILSSGAAFTEDGAVKGAVRLDGSTGVVTTSGPVVRTDRSFTIGGYVRLDRLPGAGDTFTALSQDATWVGGFFLGYRRDAGGTSDAGGKWELYMPSADADASTRPSDELVRSAVSHQPKPTQWTHLTAVYDAAAKQMRLYVDGELAGTAARTKGFDAPGPLVIGRARYQKQPSNFWPGSVDEVRAYSRALSADEIEGIVGRDGVPAGQWRLDGTADDASGGPRAELRGGPTWAAGQSMYPDPADLAVQLDGWDDHVSAGNVVDTSQSFSVSAWVRLDEAGKWSTAVSQDGQHASAFYLQAMADGHWCFFGSRQDALDPPGARAKSSGLAQLGVWTHLAGVYREQTKQIELYVNGVLAGTAPHDGNVKAVGGLQIGRAKHSGNSVDFFPGAIDDVNVYSRPLFADEIKVMAGRDLSLVHNWRLDESSGGNAADAVGTRAAKLSGGARFAPGRVGNGVAFDGVDGAAATGGIDFRADQSFTVAAWVHLPERNCDLNERASCRMDAITVDGGVRSKFRLGHVVDDVRRPKGAWVFEMPEQDTGRATKAALSTEPTEVGDDVWVHLVGVYDAASKKIWLYVNGTRVGDGTLNTPWPASGALQIGRGKTNGELSGYWKGRVDDVRVYTGALDKDRILGLVNSYPARIGPDTLPAADGGRWEFDEGAGTTAEDSSSRGLPATLKGGAEWISGRTGQSAWLDGWSGYVETEGPAVDTGRSFSATGWAYLTETNVDRTVLSQDGDRNSAFRVQYRASDNKWAVVAPVADTDGADEVVLASAQAAAAHQWTNLAVVYDADQHQLRLYVNGVLSAAQVDVTVWGSGGPFAMGRARVDGQHAEFFSSGIDDVRAYPSALADGEVRKVYDDAYAVDYGVWRFDDGTAKDYNWSHNDLTTTAGASFGPGVSGLGLRLNGTTGAATSSWKGVSTRDSFTVSAWARLSTTDKVATVLGQDGGRTSGFVLQYRPGASGTGPWVFGARAQDANSAELVYAASPRPAKAGEWTHLTGVYDHAARQLRLYVDGEFTAARDGVALWSAEGPLTIGQSKVDGTPAEHFPGTIDEIRTDVGMATDEQIAQRATWPKPVGGQLGRYVNGAGERYSANTDGDARAGYTYETTLGTLVPSPHENTTMLYACRAGADGFTSTDAACEGTESLGEIGHAYTVPPPNFTTLPVYRCRTASERFESLKADCEGATQERLLGHVLPYGALTRYNGPSWDHVTTYDGSPVLPPGYAHEGTQGWVALAALPGTQPLTSCRDVHDQFVSLDPACEGKTVLGSLGHIWTAEPSGVASMPLYSCRISGESYTSLQEDCEGYEFVRQLGYVLIGAPDEEPLYHPVEEDPADEPTAEPTPGE
ncbi:LamG domain-containing protein [Actinomycetes bacterium KLBMP 9797]